MITLINVWNSGLSNRNLKLTLPMFYSLYFVVQETMLCYREFSDILSLTVGFPVDVTVRKSKKYFVTKYFVHDETWQFQWTEYL